jgi:hypothetical protein
MAPHYAQKVEQSYLGRLDRLWDQLAVSAVTRDRHWIAAIRTLVCSRTGP